MITFFTIYLIGYLLAFFVIYYILRLEYNNIDFKGIRACLAFSFLSWSVVIGAISGIILINLIYYYEKKKEL